MLIGCMAVIVAILWLFPDTELSRSLHRHLVEGPERWMANATRADVLYVAFLLILLVTAGEAVTLFGTEALFACSWDLAFYFDVMVPGLVIAAVARLRGVARIAIQRLAIGFARTQRRGGRAVRSRRHKMPSRSANDDDGPAFAFAA